MRADCPSSPIIGHGFAEAVRSHVWHPEFVAGRAPLRGEVLGVAQRASGRREEGLLLADVRPLATHG
jgi:hypothetical protein